MLLVPRWIDCQRVTFKYGLGDEFIDVLQTLHKLGLDSHRPGDGPRASRSRPATWSPRACPNPADLGDEIEGKTCAGTWVTGTGTDGAPREVYLYHVVDNAETMARDGARPWSGRPRSCPVVALELIAEGVWSGAGVARPRGARAGPFLDRPRR